VTVSASLLFSHLACPHRTFMDFSRLLLCATLSLLLSRCCGSADPYSSRRWLLDWVFCSSTCRDSRPTRLLRPYRLTGS